MTFQYPTVSCITGIGYVPNIQWLTFCGAYLVRYLTLIVAGILWYGTCRYLMVHVGEILIISTLFFLAEISCSSLNPLIFG